MGHVARGAGGVREAGPRVLVGSAFPAARARVRAQLPAFEVVGELFLPADLASAPDADALVLDADFLGGLAALPESQLPPLVVLAADEEALEIMRELRPPGWALLPPDASAQELRAGIAAAMLGWASLPVRVAEHLPSERLLAPEVGETFAARPAFESFGAQALTPREQDVLALLSRGEPNKRIAAWLGVSENTVKFHLSALYGKLGVGSRAAALREGVRRGLVSI